MTERLLGVTRDILDRQIINWITLNAKFYIQKRKLFHKADISLSGFLTEIRSRLLTERNACLMEGRLRKFNRWRLLYMAVGGDHSL